MVFMHDAKARECAAPGALRCWGSHIVKNSFGEYVPPLGVSPSERFACGDHAPDAGCHPRSVTIPTPTVRRDLLERLADLLDTVEDERFDYDTPFWAHGDATRPGECGTVACALGYATLIPETGLSLRRCSGGWRDWQIGLFADGDTMPGSIGLGSHAEWTTMLHDAAKAFGITFREAEALFSPSSGFRWGGWLDGGGYMRGGNHIGGPDENASPREVAAWIRRLIPLFEEIRR